MVVKVAGAGFVATMVAGGAAVVVVGLNRAMAETERLDEVDACRSESVTR